MVAVVAGVVVALAVPPIRQWDGWDVLGALGTPLAIVLALGVLVAERRQSLKHERARDIEEAMALVWLSDKERLGEEAMKHRVRCQVALAMLDVEPPFTEAEIMLIMRGYTATAEHIEGRDALLRRLLAALEVV